MPQLDLVIAFSQIFWLITIFFVFYAITIYFFMPKFIKVLKTRKQIVFENTKSFFEMEKTFNSKQLLLNKTLENNFFKIRLLLEKDIVNFISTKNLVDSTPTTLLVVNVIYYNTLYYNTDVLESITLKPMFLQ